MWPARTGSPSTAAQTGRSVTRARIRGRTLVPPGATWSTTRTGQRSCAGSAATTLCSASTPPADAPRTTMPEARVVGEVAEATQPRLLRRPVPGGRGAQTSHLGPAARPLREDGEQLAGARELQR